MIEAYKEELTKIGKKNRIDIINKFNEEDKNDVCCELLIGSFLSDILGSNEELFYEKEFYNQKTGEIQQPDWFVKSTNTIVEVTHLHEAKEGEGITQFQNTIVSKIEEIPGNDFLSIEFDSLKDDKQLIERKFATTHTGNKFKSFFKYFNYDEFIKEFKKWYSQRDLSEKIFKSENGITLKILDINLDSTGKLEILFYQGQMIKYKPKRIDGKIFEKGSKYNDIIEFHELEYILAIEIDPKNGLNDMDARKYAEDYFKIEHYKNLLSAIIFNRQTFYSNPKISDGRLSDLIENYFSQN